MTDPQPSPPRRICETCANFTACDLDDPDDEVGKCWLDAIDADGYTPWRDREHTCDSWMPLPAPPEPHREQE